MKRTRKWAYVKQEAERLAGLGASPAEIARQLGVNRSTVTRWIAAGKLPRAERVTLPPVPVKSPADWAAAVRQDYQLDATDEQLVTMAEQALELAQHPDVGVHARLAAMGRFQTLTRQLALVARHAAEGASSVDAPPGPPARAAVSRPGTDPRLLFMTAVK